MVLSAMKKKAEMAGYMVKIGSLPCVLGFSGTITDAWKRKPAVPSLLRYHVGMCQTKNGQ
jgi:hypothetical protein